jgi:hypothetical protein
MPRDPSASQVSRVLLCGLHGCVLQSDVRACVWRGLTNSPPQSKKVKLGVFLKTFCVCFETVTRHNIMAFPEKTFSFVDHFRPQIP